MKNKSTLLIIVLSFIAMFQNSCTEKSTPPFLTIDSKSVNFYSVASTRDIPVKTNVENWSATVEPAAQSWISARLSGSLLRVAVEENKESGTRKGEIKVVADNITETVTVEQLGTEPAILLSSETFNLPADGGKLLLEITSNIEYDVVIPDDIPWIALVPVTRSMEMVKKEFQIQVEWNGSNAERRAELVVKQRNGSLEKKVLIVQKPQEGYGGVSENDIKDDVKVTVKDATVSSHQTGEGIERSFDGDYTTFYHSAWNNSGTNYFPITLNYNFEDQESIDYLIYHPRTDGSSNGHFKEVEIWVSTESEPTLEKIMDFDFKGAGAATKIIFEEPLVKPKTVRFVVHSGAGDGQGFASCAEMEFYRYNPDNFDPSQIFTDLTCTELKPGIGMDEIANISN